MAVWSIFKASPRHVKKAASDLGLGGGYRRVLQFPPPLITSKSQIILNMAENDVDRNSQILYIFDCKYI